MNGNGINKNTATNGTTHERSVTRKPLFIFKQLKKAENKAEIKRLKVRLKALRAQFPENLKFGAAVGNGGCFFDAMAQGLKPFFVNADFNVISLRQSCRQYAEKTRKSAFWLDDALAIEGLSRDGYISGESVSGSLDIEGRIVCEIFSVKIIVFELRDEKIDANDIAGAEAEREGFHINHTKMGKGKNVVYLMKQRNHFVPLLGNIESDVAEKIKVAWREVYGGGEACDVGDDRKENDLVGSKGFEARKRKLDDFETNDLCVLPKKARLERNIGLVSASNGAIKLKSIGSETVTRKPLPILKNLRKASDPAQRSKLSEVLSTLRAHMPNDLKIAAAVGSDDNFFDALAQSLNELCGGKASRFYVKTLRELCKRHALLATKESWLRAVLKSMGEKFSAYKKNIEFTVEELKKAKSVDIMNTVEQQQQPKYAIAGRPEIEGLIISQELGVKIKIFTLFTDEFDVAFVKIQKIGKGKQLVYMLQYQNRFVPLLHNIDDDIIFKMEVAKEAVYDNCKSLKRKSVHMEAVPQNFNKHACLENGDFNGAATFVDLVESKPLVAEYANGQRIGISVENSPKGFEDFESTTNVTSTISTAAYPASAAVNPATAAVDLFTATANPAASVAATVNKVIATALPASASSASKCVSAEFSKPQDRQFSSCRLICYRLLQFNYQFELWTLCLLRKSLHREKYAATTLNFDDAMIENFKHITIKHKNTFICIQIENIEKYYVANDINFSQLFSKTKRSFALKFYFESFRKYLKDAKNELTTKNLKYLVIYTNAALDINDELRLTKGKFKDFCAFKFDKLENRVLKDLLFTNNQAKRRAFYQFAKNEVMRKKLLKRLVVTANDDDSDIDELKGLFLDKLVFVVNQPEREELHACIKKEIESLQVNVRPEDMPTNFNGVRRAVFDILKPNKRYGLDVVLEFELLISFLHDLLSNDHEIFGSLNTESYLTSNDIILNYGFQNRVYIKCYHMLEAINYVHFFPSKRNEWKHVFSLNNCFKLYLAKLAKFGSIEFFIVYTNASLSLVEGNRLKKMHTKLFYAFQFESLDLKLEKYEIFRKSASINEHELFQLSRRNVKDYKELLRRLILPKEMAEKIGKDNAEERLKLKKQFLKSLIFAVNQVVNVDARVPPPPYHNEELQEAAARWSESHDLAAMTKPMLLQLLQDIQAKRTSYCRIEKNIEKELRFASSVASARYMTQFLDFCLKGAGKACMATIAKHGIKLTNVSGIISGAKGKAELAFVQLFECFFDEDGNKSKYLETLEAHNINLSSVSSILHETKVYAPAAFRDLFELWFDANGEKTQYLTTLEKEDILLSSMCSILRRSATQAATAYKEFYNLCFDVEGNKSIYLQNLATENIDFRNVSSLLSGAGAKAAQSFKALYELWFDDFGKTTPYIKSLKMAGINLTNVTSMLGGAGANAAKAFKALYDLWFDEAGNSTHYLQTLKRENINFTNISSILGVSGAFAAKAFKELYELMFDDVGNKTTFLKTLEREGITLNILSSILHRTGASAGKAFKNLYKLWFDKNGEKTQYLVRLAAENIDLNNMSSILHGAGVNGATSFKNLYDLWFDENGEKTPLLENMENDGLMLIHITFILHGAGPKAPKVFRDLYRAFYDEADNKKLKYQHFLEHNRTVTAANLANVIRKTGVSAKTAFENFHKICFDLNGQSTPILNDFFRAGFKLNNLLTALYGAGTHAPNVLKNFHAICFDTQRTNAITPILSDYFALGFRPSQLCQMLKGASKHLVKYMKNFHDFCFRVETSKYLKRFLDESAAGFTPKNLAKILDSVGVFICSALKDFHAACFDKQTGDESEILIDFRKVGFTASDLTKILTKAGIKAKFILKKFHKICFNAEQPYLQHFLNESVIFTPKILANLLCGKGSEVCNIFKKLHELCFKNTGKKTKYLKKLLKQEPSQAIECLKERVEQFLRES